jgi:hypothetical protein
MTAAQKKARDNFKKAIAYRKKTGCTLKEAFAHVKGASVKGLDKVVKKGNKTAVIYSKKAALKKKAAPKNKVVKQGKLFDVGAISLKTLADEFNSLDYKIYQLKQQKKDAKTIAENKNIQEKISILNKQFQALKVYLNTVTKFK